MLCRHLTCRYHFLCAFNHSVTTIVRVVCLSVSTTGVYYSSTHKSSHLLLPPTPSLIFGSNAHDRHIHNHMPARVRQGKLSDPAMKLAKAVLTMWHGCLVYSHRFKVMLFLCQSTRLVVQGISKEEAEDCHAGCSFWPARWQQWCQGSSDTSSQDCIPGEPKCPVALKTQPISLSARLLPRLAQADYCPGKLTCRSDALHHYRALYNLHSQSLEWYLWQCTAGVNKYCDIL